MFGMKKARSGRKRFWRDVAGKKSKSKEKQKKEVEEPTKLR
jgi:hypothetical protein